VVRAAGLFAGSLFILLLVTGCSGIPSIPTADSHLKSAVQLHDVPFFPQKQYQCGPAALAMVLNHADVSVSPEELVKQVYLPGRKGSLQIELLASSRHYQRIPYVIPPRLEALMQELEAGNPVLVLQNLGLKWIPVWHYAVVIGYDLQQQLIILHSGTDRARAVAMKTFAHTWQRANNWGLVITTLDRIPASAEAEPFVSAISTLKGEDNRSNRHRAYQAAARRWPRQWLTQFSLGNSFYANGELIAAEQVYRRLLADYPDSAPLLNNLAQTLADQDKLEEARAIARQASELGGPYGEQIHDTLEGIEKRLGLH